MEATSILDHSFKNVHSAVKARLNVSVEKGPVDPMLNIFEAFPGIKFMTLPLLTTKVMCFIQFRFNFYVLITNKYSFGGNV